MADRHLAALYGVPTKVLNQAVVRNRARFPADFMFRLSREELNDWKSQIVTSNSNVLMGLRKRPYVFTEQGVAMLSSVLRSARAVKVNIEIIRAFVRMRRAAAADHDLARRLASVEKQLEGHQGVLGEHAAAIRQVFEDIRGLIGPTEGPRKRIGFRGP